MEDKAYEKLGAFYLGRPYDLEQGETRPEPLLYDAKDLVTHAMCVGMTGSGKTGLCIGLLEEAAIDGVPALVIDPKGDIGNLMLTFPKLEASDFRPWVNEDDARRKGVEPDAFAAQQADLWRNGLASWDQEPSRIERLRAAVDISIYTPGSEAGLPVSILSSFAAPPQAVLDDADAFKERVATAATSLLGLLGVDADPIRSREHILLSNLFADAWRAGQDLDLAGLIQGIQDPPIETVGVMPLESFFPAKDRFGLAMQLNNLLASPGFASWLTGAPLDVDKMLYTETGKPRIAIFSISHLSDPERMFFVSLLLNQTLSWMRSRSGTSSLRALLYMDEIFGYLPPVANPPSKPPLLTMLKQARAFGLGLVLATQNPVDLDYKALSNIGTWFLGRLQTERDKLRVLDGLESAAGGNTLSRRDIERILSGLGKRVFLLHNVHENGPAVFQTRWVLSYLRGPLTRDQIKSLMADRKAALAASTAAAPVAAPAAVAAPSVASAAVVARPVLPPAVKERFVPVAGRPDGIEYRPFLVGAARVHFVDSRKGLETQEDVVQLVPIDPNGDVDWYAAQELDIEADRLERDPASDEVSFGELADAAGTAARYKRWTKDFDDALYRSRRHPLFQSTTFKLISEPGEAERDFRIRLSDVAHEARDEAVEKLRDRYASKFRTVEDRIRRTEQRVERESQQASSQKMQTAIQIGSTLLGALFGRRRSITTATRSVGRIAKERGDVKRAEEELVAQKQRLEELNAELAVEVETLGERFDPEREELEIFELKPRRTDIDVRLLALAWAPYRQGEPAW